MSNSNKLTNIYSLDYLKNLQKYSSTFSKTTSVNLDDLKSAFPERVHDTDQESSMGSMCTAMDKQASRKSVHQVQAFKTEVKANLQCSVESLERIDLGEEAISLESTLSHAVENNETGNAESILLERGKRERIASKPKSKEISDEHFNSAIKRRWDRMEIIIRDWIHKHFNWKNYRTDMYNLIVDKNWEDYEIFSQIPGKKRQKFATDLDSKFELYYIKNVSEIVNRIFWFESQVETRLQSCLYLEKQCLDDVLPRDYDIITSAIKDPSILSIFQSVRNRLLDYSKDFIKMYLHNECILREEVKARIMIYHNEKMKSFMINRPHCKNDFSSFTAELSMELTKVYVDVMQFSSGKSNLSVIQKCEELKAAMTRDFSSNEAINLLKISQFHVITKGIISTCQQTYTKRINAIASHYSNGTHCSILEAQNAHLSNEVCKILESEIRSKVGAFEPVVGYRAELQFHMQTYFEKIVKANNEKFEKYLQANPRQYLHLDDSSGPNLNSNLASVHPAAKDEHKKQNRTLVVDFKNCTHLSMAVKLNNKTQILYNEFNEWETPAIVGYSYLNLKFLYGNKVQWYMVKYNLAHHLDTDYKSSNGIIIDGVFRTMSFEFLLAFLLRKLKYTAEAQVGNLFQSVVIIIPFWFSSNHRMKMKDGAKLAGFSKVYLVHEPSCAAFACTPITTDENLLVITANRHGVRAFHYNCSKTDRKIRMINYWNIFDIKYNNGVLDIVDGNGKGSKSFTAEYQNAKQLIIKDIDRVIEEMCDENYRFQVYVTGTEEWKELLREMGQELPYRLISFPDAVLCGALDLSLDPECISNSIDDILSYNIFSRDLSIRHKVLLSFACPKKRLPFKENFIATKGWIDFLEKHELDEKYRIIEKLEVQTNWSNQLVKITTEISKEGIFKSQRCDPYCSSDEAKKLKREERPVVYPNLPNISKIEFRAALIWLDELLPAFSPEKFEIIQAKKQLVKLCLDMRNKIETKELFIKSKLNKIEVLDQVSEAQEFAQHQNTSMDDLKGQYETLEKLFEYYSKKQNHS